MLLASAAIQLVPRRRCHSLALPEASACAGRRARCLTRAVGRRIWHEPVQDSVDHPGIRATALSAVCRVPKYDIAAAPRITRAATTSMALRTFTGQRSRRLGGGATVGPGSCRRCLTLRCAAAHIPTASRSTTSIARITRFGVMTISEALLDYQSGIEARVPSPAIFGSKRRPAAGGVTDTMKEPEDRALGRGGARSPSM